MTKKEIADAKEAECILLFLEREADRIRKYLAGTFELLHVDYDDRRDRLVYIGEGNDDGVGTGTQEVHSIDEMMEMGWIDELEDEDDDEGI